MQAVNAELPQRPLKLRLAPVVELDDEQLFALCSRNPELRIERTAEGELTFMSPTGSKTSFRNAAIVAQLHGWARRDSSGLVFDSSGGFILPNGAMRAPDAAWVRLSQLQALNPAQREGFLPLCPAFVVELRSSSDSLESLQRKMEEYLANGAALGWLIDPTEKRLHIYRPERAVDILESPTSVAGDPELPGFKIELDEIWHPGW